MYALVTTQDIVSIFFDVAVRTLGDFAMQRDYWPLFRAYQAVHGEEIS